MTAHLQLSNVGIACWDNMPHSIRSQILNLVIPTYSGSNAVFCADGSIELAALRPYFVYHGAVFQIDRGTREAALNIFFRENDVRVCVQMGTPLYKNEPAVRFGFFRMRTLVIDLQLHDDWQLNDYVLLISYMAGLRHLQINAVTGHSANLVPRTDWADIDANLRRVAHNLYTVAQNFRRVIRQIESVHIIFPQETNGVPYDRLICEYLARAFIMKASVEQDGLLSYIVRRTIRKARTKIAITWPLCDGFQRRYMNEPFC